MGILALGGDSAASGASDRSGAVAVIGVGRMSGQLAVFLAAGLALGKLCASRLAAAVSILALGGDSAASGAGDRSGAVAVILAGSVSGQFAVFLAAGLALGKLCAGCASAVVSILALGGDSAASGASDRSGAVAVILAGSVSGQFAVFLAAGLALGKLCAGCASAAVGILALGGYGAANGAGDCGGAVAVIGIGGVRRAALLGTAGAFQPVLIFVCMPFGRISVPAGRSQDLAAYRAGLRRGVCSGRAGGMRRNVRIFAARANMPMFFAVCRPYGGGAVRLLSAADITQMVAVLILTGGKRGLAVVAKMRVLSCFVFAEGGGTAIVAIVVAVTVEVLIHADLVVSFDSASKIADVVVICIHMCDDVGGRRIGVAVNIGIALAAASTDLIFVNDVAVVILGRQNGNGVRAEGLIPNEVGLIAVEQVSDFTACELLGGLSGYAANFACRRGGEVVAVFDDADIGYTIFFAGFIEAHHAADIGIAADIARVVAVFDDSTKSIPTNHAADCVVVADVAHVVAVLDGVVVIA